MLDNFDSIIPIKPKVRKQYTEELAFLLFKHIFPKIASSFSLKDAPDLQSEDKSVGIEITQAISQDNARIDGEYSKLYHGYKLENAKEKCKERIAESGGKIDEFSISYTATDSEKEWGIIADALNQKIKLLPKYREKGFKKMGLFILLDEPPIPFDPNQVIKKFASIQKNSEDHFDFILLGYYYGVIYFDFCNMEYKPYNIGQEKFIETRSLARKLVNG